MPRKRLIRNNVYPYHVTARSNNKEWFYLPIDDVWKVFCQKLTIVSEEYSARIHCFLLMSNHFHLMLSTPLANVDEIMRYLMTEVSRTIARKSNRINHVFGGRYRPTFLPDAASMAYVYKYILRNPVRARIIDCVQDYRYSSLSALLKSEIPIVEGFDWKWVGVPKPLQDRLDWLNKPTPKELEEIVGKTLRRKTFTFSKDKKVQLRLKKLRKSYYEV